MKIPKRDLSLLISINDDIAAIKENEKLFNAIFTKLHNYYNLNVMGISVIDRKKNMIGSIIGKVDDLNESLRAPQIWFNAYPLDKLPIDLHLDNPEVLTIEANKLFSYQKTEKIQAELQTFLDSTSIENFLFAPMRTGGELVGFLIVPMLNHPPDDEDKDYLIKIANLIGSAISNVKAYEELKQKEKATDMQFRLLYDLVTIKDKDDLFSKLAKQIDRLIPCDYVALYAGKKDAGLSTTISLYKENNENFKVIPTTRSIALSLLSLQSKKLLLNPTDSLEISGELYESLCKDFPYFRQLKDKFLIKALIILKYGNPELGELGLIIGRSNPFQWLKIDRHFEHMMFSQNTEIFFGHYERELGLQILPPVGLLLSNVFAFDEIRTLTKKLEQEKNYLLDEINLTNNFQEIIGESTAIQNTLNKVKQVAPLDATVLIQGETGTGKELIAKAVHNLSKRKDKAFITVNCASLPSQLIESELFGHEKGSFTSAIEKRIGKFEVADGGTIFLDEIGELPLEVQAKLLRVLQEKEFERLGGKSTIHSDVRILAATNRDLEKEAANGKFRADLFFRLNVFPILVPTLRERIEDIPLLVKYFFGKYSKKVGKNVSSIRKTDMDLLMSYNWPGNIRELEHMVERVIIVSSGDNLNFESLFSPDIRKTEPDFTTFKTLEEVEKEHIVNALKAANGKVTGDNSASQLLGINGKTLGSRMRKLKIKRAVSISTEKD